MSGALVDTNLFVYAFDPADPVKHQQAIRLIDEIGREVEGVRFVNPFLPE